MDSFLGITMLLMGIFFLLVIPARVLSEGKMNRERTVTAIVLVMLGLFLLVKGVFTLKNI